MSTLDPRRRVEERPWHPKGWKTASASERVELLMRSLRVPQGHGAGEAFSLLPWEQLVLRGLLAETRPTVGIVNIPRANGKTSFAAAWALAMAVAAGDPAPFVPVIATSEQQARRLLAVVVRYVRAHPQLAARAKVYSDRVRFDCYDHAEIVALPAERAGLLGLDFSACVLDEVGAMTSDVFEAAVTAQGKRPGAVLLAIGSCVPGGTALLPDLLAAAEREPSWRAWRWSAPAGCDVLDEAAWEASNPSLDVLVTRSTMRSLAATVPEPIFRAYRLNEFVHASGTWIAPEAWSAIADRERVVPDGTEIVAAFDGSWVQDSTAIVACTIAQPRHVFVIDAWEKSEPGWRVPRDDVHASIDAMFGRYRVRRLLVDRFGWQSELQQWAERYGGDVVLEYPMSRQRFGPACDLFYTAVHERAFTQSGDARLARHLANTRTKATPQGVLIEKAHHDSTNKIDLAVCAAIAYQASTQVPTRRLRAVGF